MKLRPLSGNLVVESAPEETKTASGILLPDSSNKEQQDRGTVVSVGPGKMLENGTRPAMDVRIGDVVIFKKWGKEEVEIEDGGVKKKFLIVSADDVMAVIE